MIEGFERSKIFERTYAKRAPALMGFIRTMSDAWGYSPPGEVQGRYWTPLTRPLSRTMTITKSIGRLTELHPGAAHGHLHGGALGEPRTQDWAKVAPRLLPRLAGKAAKDGKEEDIL